MEIRSVNDQRYSRRFILMGVVVVGFALYFLYDGAIGWPRQRERALAYLKLEEELSGADPSVFRERWDAYTSQRGWSTEYPGEPKSEVEIKMQYAWAALCGSLGLPMLLMALNSRRHWIEASNAGLTSSWGERFNFDQIVQLDKKRWRNKGIAKLTYQDGERKRRFVLDDYKYERPTMDAILHEVEQRIDPAMIVNGPPDPPPEQRGHQPVESQ